MFVNVGGVRGGVRKVYLSGFLIKLGLWGKLGLNGGWEWGEGEVLGDKVCWLAGEVSGYFLFCDFYSFFFYFVVFWSSGFYSVFLGNWCRVRFFVLFYIWSKNLGGGFILCLISFFLEWELGVVCNEGFRERKFGFVL